MKAPLFCLLVFFLDVILLPHYLWATLVLSHELTMEIILFDEDRKFRNYSRAVKLVLYNPPNPPSAAEF